MLAYPTSGGSGNQGGVFAGLGIGGIAGAALVGPITVRAGFGRTVIATLLVWAIGVLSLAAVPMQSGSTVAAPRWVVSSQRPWDFARPFWSRPRCRSLPSCCWLPRESAASCRLLPLPSSLP
jgi:hypothetical protein